ncbi:hypothetical protein [Bacillus sp. UNCCL81]|uniref:hypothetical protein n=1 Tax=Bacillus sp. UNCCL81 TaxID=1502755 RepID=UPI0008EBA554|nr:hypothetical protein [Bacillus sp. UNCCL81]SFC95070.1 hypothetical protein SAMN02799633_02110 [Bacillus sp. UNCCL81]
MKLNSSYPYPVLFEGNDDYINSEFNVDIAVDESFGELKITTNFKLQNEELEHLIHKEMAVYMIHIECPQTSFRKAYNSTEEILNIAIKSSEIRGKVIIHSFVVALKNIENYTNIFLNEWYKDSLITFEKGNFLAIGDAIEVTLLEENIEHMNLPSIVSIHKSDTNEFMEVDLSSSNINILLPKYEYEQYANASNSNLKSTILSMVIMPCLTHTFSQIAENSEDYEDNLWYQVMKKLFKDNGYDIADVGSDTLPPLKATQLVLRKPVKTSFEEISKFHNMED